MMLEKQQINRYKRQIKMPEISEAGQIRLLESGIGIYCESLRDIAPVLYYLAASGVGYISCFCEDTEGASSLYENIRDLNPDVELKLTDNCTNINEDINLQILFGSPCSIGRLYSSFSRGLCERDFKPTIIASKNSWSGLMGTFAAPENLSSFIALLNNAEIRPFTEKKAYPAAYLLGALTAAEGIKACLGLSSRLNGGMFFDLFDMSFDSFTCDTAKSYIDKLAQAKVLQLNEEKLSKTKVLMIGTGGLGSPAAYAMTMSGVGTVGLVDYDNVEISNLNRQILHSTSRIGMPKTVSAKSFLERLSPATRIITHNVKLCGENVGDIIKDYDVIIDAVDNLPTRYILNDACHFAGKPLVEAGVMGFNGLAVTVLSGRSTCYRCIFPEEFALRDMPVSSEFGVLGPIPGIMGFIQAAEAVKLLSGEGTLLTDKILLYDGLELDFSIPSYEREPGCALCGANPSIKKP